MNPTIIAAIIGFFIILSVKDTPQSRRNICILMCICFICQAGLRDYLHSTNDTYNYLASYRFIENDTLWQVITENKFEPGVYDERDPGYNIFVKVTQIIWPDFRFFLIIVATIISVPICKLIYKFTDNLTGIVVAAILYEALLAGFFETGIRQTIAMGTIYFSVPYIINRNWKKHYLLLALAYTVHSSALIFAPFYFLINIQKSKKYLIWCICLTPLFMIIAKPLIVFMGEGTNFEDYANTTIDNTGTPVFSIFVFIIAIWTYLTRNYININNIKDRILITGIICSLVLMPSTWVNSNFIRLVFYYLIFLLPMMPKLLLYTASNNMEAYKQYSFMTGIALILLTIKQGL